MLVNEDPKMATKKSLKIIHMNARSLLFHLDEVLSFVLSHRPDILAVSETWLDLSVSDCGVFLSGYHLYIAVIARALVVVSVSMLLSTCLVLLSFTPLVFVIMVLTTCGSLLALLNHQKVALLLVAFIGVRTVLTTIVRSQSYQQLAKSWRNMSRSICPTI